MYKHVFILHKRVVFKMCRYNYILEYHTILITVSAMKKKMWKTSNQNIESFNDCAHHYAEFAKAASQSRHFINIYTTWEETQSSNIGQSLGSKRLLLIRNIFNSSSSEASVFVLRHIVPCPHSHQPFPVPRDSVEELGVRYWLQQEQLAT